jgi:uncharacterized membrane protein
VKPAPEVNVPTQERLGSVIGGGAMIYFGLRKRSLGGLVLAGLGAALMRRGVTGHCSGYATLGLNRARGDGAAPDEYSARGIHVAESVTVQATPEELYNFWRNLENLPLVMGYLQSVTALDDRRSRWVAKAPAGISVSWEAEIINDTPNELIAWRSLYPAAVDNAGSVRFAALKNGVGTLLSVTLDYIPPAGRAGWLVARLFGQDPASEVRKDLHRFKAIIERVPSNSSR